MRKAKYLIAVIMLCLLVNLTAVDKIVFYTQDFPPFTFKFSSHISGPFVDIIKEVCKEIGVEAEFGMYEWGEAIKKAKDGEAHALFVMGKNESRKSWLYFSHPIVETQYGFFVGSDNDVDYSRPEHINNYKIAVYGPSNTEKTLRKIEEKNKTISIEVYPEDETAFQMVSLGKADAVFSNVDVGNSLVQRLNLRNVRYAGYHKKLNYYIGFLKKNIDKETFDKFNAKLKEMRDSGRIKEILDMYHMKIAE